MSSEKPRLIWTTTLMLSLTSLIALIGVPCYAWRFGLDTSIVLASFLLLAATGMSITAGYHRLWAHRSYEAHALVRIFLMIFGSMAVQNSILIWASGHRTHHRHVDDHDRDPYSARRGFWFSHIGWMLREYPSGQPCFDNARDLLDDQLVMFQHRHYLSLVLLTNFAIPALIGWFFGHMLESLLLCGFLRLVLSHHFTFFINSLAHTLGQQPYTDENTACDNAFFALLTWGEGYHNYHHLFQWDYRNAIHWWQYDPTKWLIYALSCLRLTYNLRRVPDFSIRRAQLNMLFKRTEQRLAEAQGHALETLKQRLSSEYEHFVHAMNEWGKLKEEWYAKTKADLLNSWESSTYHDRFREIELRLELMQRRLQNLHAQLV